MLTWEPVNQPPINHTITEGKFRTMEAVNWSLIGKTAVAAVTGADSPGGRAREERYGGHLIIIILHSTRGSPGQAKALTAAPLLSWPREHTSCLFTYVTQLWRLPFTSGWIFSACFLTLASNSTLLWIKCGSVGRANHSGNEGLTLFHLLHDNTAFQ